jgi:hypothetical protein
MYPLPGNGQAGTYISSVISALWAECHISPYLYSSLYLYNQVKDGRVTSLRAQKTWPLPLLHNLATECVYRAVAWQRVDQIRYNIM